MLGPPAVRFACSMVLTRVTGEDGGSDWAAGVGMEPLRLRSPGRVHEERAHRPVDGHAPGGTP